MCVTLIISFMYLFFYCFFLFFNLQLYLIYFELLLLFPFQYFSFFPSYCGKISNSACGLLCVLNYGYSHTRTIWNLLAFLFTAREIVSLVTCVCSRWWRTVNFQARNDSSEFIHFYGDLYKSMWLIVFWLHISEVVLLSISVSEIKIITSQFIIQERKKKQIRSAIVDI